MNIDPVSANNIRQNMLAILQIKPDPGRTYFTMSQVVTACAPRPVTQALAECLECGLIDTFKNGNGLAQHHKWTQNAKGQEAMIVLRNDMESDQRRIEDAAVVRRQQEQDREHERSKAQSQKPASGSDGPRSAETVPPDGPQGTEPSRSSRSRPRARGASHRAS